MIRRLRLYREYRRQGLRQAWHYAGMGPVAWSVAKYAAIVASAVAIAVALSRQAEAIQDAADNRVAAKVSNQAGEIEELRRLLAACLGNREGALWIGGELHLCRAVPTGIRQ